MKYKNIPIKAAKQIAQEFDKDQVIIVTWDKKHGKTHVTTYGKTLQDCEQAAIGGNFVKKAMGWPEELCQAKSARVKKKASIKHDFQNSDQCLRCGAFYNACVENLSESCNKGQK